MTTPHAALAALWDLQGEADLAARMDGQVASQSVWLAHTTRCLELIAIVAAAGEAHRLPPDLRVHRTWFNSIGWRIPAVNNQGNGDA